MWEVQNGMFLLSPACVELTEFSHWWRFLILQRRNADMSMSQGVLVGLRCCKSNLLFLHHSLQGKIPCCDTTLPSLRGKHPFQIASKKSSCPTISKMGEDPQNKHSSNRTEPYLDLKGHNIKKSYLFYKPYSPRIGTCSVFGSPTWDFPANALIDVMGLVLAKCLCTL